MNSEAALTIATTSGGQASSSSSSRALEEVSMPRQQLLSVIDSLTRAETAARQCSRISQQASNAFSDEANNIASCKCVVEALLMRHAI